ncbi:glycosyltransferase family 4 protein [Actinomyces radicidentis]|uniref:glycosyltransferase family 4 protein n=1 Tax=Actinomyces radicidentis TaxID=111015 RepID=UPI0026DFCD06|nr:glycosyltransferase family 4 protein [Actinomyces radicidentis]
MSADVTRARVLVVTLDTLGDRMAGPAIRAWEITAHLAARGHWARLVTFAERTRRSPDFEVASIGVDSFRKEVEAVDVVIIQGYVAATFPWLADVDQKIVYDLYDPFHLESLEVERYQPLPLRHAALARALTELGTQIARGDFFICASEKQRDLWLGHLAAAGRVNPLTYDSDPSLRELIDVVPFGTADVQAEQRRHALKGAVPGITEDDPVVIWGGGVYNWFDPLSVVRAIDQVRAEVPNVRMVFLGMKHPNPDVPEMRMAARTRQEADRLGLTGRHVFFHEDWVEYDDRVNFLMDADVGISTHFAHIETDFSFRTRILDYLWTGLPIVSSDGDAFASLITAESLGRVVPVGDVDALAQALALLLTDPAGREETRQRVNRAAAAYRWEQVLAPLFQFCDDPRHAADWAEHTAVARPVSRPGVLTALRSDARAAVRVLRAQGLRGVAAKVRWRLARFRR